MHDYRPPIEGEYLPPEPKPKTDRLKGAGAAAVGIGVLFAKFKGLLFFLLNFKFALIGLKLLASAGGFLISLWFYTQFFGFQFALVFLLQIFIHEMGHLAAMRAYGVPSSLPFFIPFMGAFINMRGRPANALQEAYIGLAGPLAGTFAATLCYLVGLATGEQFWIACANAGFFINAFNMIPLVPLDGGRAVGAISPRIWVVGLIILVTAAFAFHWNLLRNPILIVFVLLSIPQVIAAWRGRLDPVYYALHPGQRVTLMAVYFGLLGYLLAALLATHITVPVR